ncbi:hypothetical protein [Mucilaginibacter antarcticus]|uniref:hypothetical protein n=1 Tax=Mucilaginibacter antarcticus TaxID=1855725 RepID=UPI0036390E72
MARHKKENKELLAYLIFEADNSPAFIEKVKAEAGFMFSQMPVRSYEAAKYLRKILRLLGKYIKFMASKEAETELLINFCTGYIQYADRRTSYKPLRTILVRQVEKTRTAIGKLHEDLQYDFITDYNAMLNDAGKNLSWFDKDSYLL